MIETLVHSSVAACTLLMNRWPDAGWGRSDGLPGPVRFWGAGISPANSLQSYHLNLYAVYEAILVLSIAFIRQQRLTV